MNIDVLIVGGGGREHALAWKIAKSKRVGKIYIAPGNAGSAMHGENVPIAAHDIANLARFASEKRIGLTVVGPDEPLALGIADLFQRSGLRIFGPSKAAAQMESSKSYAKQLMREAHIPTAEFRTFTDYEQAKEYAYINKNPLAVKASGLAAGKGVYICATLEEKLAALDQLMVQHVHGDSGDEVVMEHMLVGEEISIHVLTDGINTAMFPASQDHKRIGEESTGKNTGGMGAVAPVPWVTPDILFQIENRIVKPILETLNNRGTPFRGLLYPGIMVTNEGPKVIEVNARFGDPETQVYMMLLEDDVLDALEACVDGTVGNVRMKWKITSAANIVLASQGYPDEFKVGFPISGILEAEAIQNVRIFHAGTKQAEGLRTAGGRVLNVCATGSPLSRAVDLAYMAAEHISFEGKYMRRDIGRRASGERQMV